MSHIISCEAAHSRKYGLEKAMLLYHFRHWIEINHAEGRNLHEERTWCYQSIDVLCAHFPFFSRTTLHRHLQALTAEDGPMIKGNFNKHKFDRTAWYSFRDENEWIRPHYQKVAKEFQNGNFDSVKLGNGRSQNGKSDIPTLEQEYPDGGPPIPDIKEDIKQKNKKDSCLPDLNKTIELGKHVEISLRDYNDLCKQYSKEVVDLKVEQMNSWIDNSKLGISPYKGKYSEKLKSWLIKAKIEGTVKAVNPVSDLDFVNKLKSFYSEKIKKGEICIGHDYVEFCKIPEAYFKIGSHGFVEKCNNTLEKIGLKRIVTKETL